MAPPKRSSQFRDGNRQLQLKAENLKRSKGALGRCPHRKQLRYIRDSEVSLGEMASKQGFIETGKQWTGKTETQ